MKILSLFFAGIFSASSLMAMPAAEFDRGKSLFENYCAMCHNTVGNVKFNNIEAKMDLPIVATFDEIEAYLSGKKKGVSREMRNCLKGKSGKNSCIDNSAAYMLIDKQMDPVGLSKEEKKLIVQWVFENLNEEKE